MGFEFIDDKVYMFTPRPDFGDYASERKLIMTKEIFIACYEKWVKNSQEKMEYEFENQNEVFSKPKGKWENIKVVSDSKNATIPEWQQAQCSVCGLWHTTPYLYHYKHYDFCPNCGAEMENGNE